MIRRRYANAYSMISPKKKYNKKLTRAYHEKLFKFSIIMFVIHRPWNLNKPPSSPPASFSYFKLSLINTRIKLMFIGAYVRVNKSLKNSHRTSVKSPCNNYFLFSRKYERRESTSRMYKSNTYVCARTITTTLW